MEYYEERFIDFEDYLNVTGQKKNSTPKNPHANSNYVLQRFQQFEKFQKKEDQKERRKYMWAVAQQKLKQEKLARKTSCSDRDTVKQVK